MQIKKPKPIKTSVKCAGCDRIQMIGKDKLIPADYYTCSLDCRKNLDWKHPATPDGKIHVLIANAAGGYVGHLMADPSPYQIRTIAKQRIVIHHGLAPINKETNG